MVFSKIVNDSICSLAEILQFPVKSPPFQHLGVDWFSITIVNYCLLVVDLHSIFIRWQNHALSYSSRIHLVEWDFKGKFQYLVQSNFMPKHTLQIIRSITYQFFWGKQKEIAWKMMTRPREGGLRIRDYEDIQQTITINRIGRLWQENGIWAMWMCDRYIKNRELDDINRRYNYTAEWKEILRNKEQAWNCMQWHGDHNYNWEWNGKGSWMSDQGNKRICWFGHLRLEKWVNSCGN